MSDPADLPDASVSIGWLTANLKNGKLEGLSTLTRQCDCCITWNFDEDFSWSDHPETVGTAIWTGTVRLTDLKVDYTAKVSGVSKDVSGTVSYVDFAISADIESCDPIQISLTQCNVTIGQIDVSVGSGWLDSVAGSIVAKATTKVSNYLNYDFEDELCNAIQDYLENESYFASVCSSIFSAMSIDFFDFRDY